MVTLFRPSCKSLCLSAQERPTKLIPSQMGADGMGRTGVFRFSGTGAEGVHLLTHAPGRGGAGSSVTTGHGVPPRQPAGRRPTLHTCLLGNVAPEVITMSKVAKAF